MVTDITLNASQETLAFPMHLTLSWELTQPWGDKTSAVCTVFSAFILTHGVPMSPILDLYVAKYATYAS